ncbi:MAG: efflux RND transporter periplasmic adaptor subunit [Bryobacterales bacterium]|nr:efflux RND transporter periplasmic adaptor subunit [Bryobacterales bacterium]
MSARSKLLWVLAALVLLAVAAFVLLGKRDSGLAVQAGTVARERIVQIVTASGEIKPNNYINIGADQMGRITDLFVKEGEAVERGQLLAKLESVQPAADVESQRAALDLMRSELRAAGAALEASDATELAQQASIERSRAEVERSKLLADRAEKLIAEGLISRDEYDRRRADSRAAEAALAEAEANLERMRAQRQELAAKRDSAEKRITQNEAQLRRARDILRKYSTVSPIDGVVTDLPVKVGETVVPGIQNSPASLIMTIADMSVITAEALVAETDIVNVKLGQRAEVSVDALPGQTFAATVTEIGKTAILRGSGLAASQSTAVTQEARDFQVTVALENPPESLRPGMSSTVRITTAVRDAVLAIPIQALTVREIDGKETEGVFVLNGDVAEYRPVQTGVSGGGSIEAVSGLSEGDRIVTGGYQALRALQSGTKIRIEGGQTGDR